MIGKIKRKSQLIAVKQCNTITISDKGKLNRFSDNARNSTKKYARFKASCDKKMRIT